MEASVVNFVRVRICVVKLLIFEQRGARRYQMAVAAHPPAQSPIRANLTGRLMSLRLASFFSLAALAAGELLCVAPAWSAQPSYPTHAIQLVVPFDAGSATDVVARAMQPALSAALGQSVVVINKAGASGTIGTAAVASAKADGYTIGLLAMGATAILPHVRKLPYDVDALDFICQVYSAPVVVMVSPTSRFHSIQELLEYGKANPDKIAYASPGIGTPDHLNTATFFRVAGVKALHVPFTGGGASVSALLSDQINVMTNTTVTLNAHHLRPLAVLTPQRLPELPDVPTAREIGIPFEASIWAVLAAPKGLAQPVKAALERACAQTLEEPRYREIAERSGFPPYARTDDALRTFIHAEFERYGKFIKDEKIDIQ
jgi:tripartite-type tricarboxylate transporter receptor subunit TctC